MYGGTGVLRDITFPPILSHHHTTNISSPYLFSKNISPHSFFIAQKSYLCKVILKLKVTSHTHK